MWSKDRAAHKAASDEFWKHWDNKSAGTETADIREVIALPEPTQSDAHIPVGPESRIRNPHTALLQPRNRSLRVWMGRMLSFLPICIWRRLLPGHRTA